MLLRKMESPCWPHANRSPRGNYAWCAPSVSATVDGFEFLIQYFISNTIISTQRSKLTNIFHQIIAKRLQHLDLILDAARRVGDK